MAHQLQLAKMIKMVIIKDCGVTLLQFVSASLVHLRTSICLMEEYHALMITIKEVFAGNKFVFLQTNINLVLQNWVFENVYCFGWEGVKLGFINKMWLYEIKIWCRLLFEMKS